MKTPRGNESPVAILTNQHDLAADRVVRHLNRLSVPVHRINIEDVVTGAVNAWSPEDPQMWRSVWWRQFVAEPIPASTVEQVDEYLIQRSQWMSWLPTMEAERWMNPVWEARRAESKVVQLRAATAAGFRVPATTVTNSVENARRFASTHGPSVAKSLSTAYWQFSDQSFVFTNRLTDEMLQADPTDWTSQPLIVQAEVDAVSEARAVWIDGTIVAVCAPRLDQVVDWRTTSGLQWGGIEVPPAVAASLSDYCRALGLVYCATDFLVDRSGEWWFLEGNQCGEWGFVDRAAETDVAGIIATWLA